jgi:zinc protease
MKFLFLLLFCIGSMALSAQEVPLNPKVLYGKLENGLTYYIQKNTLPKDRAMFYLVENAGAIDEDDNQNGLAHFCEHMGFNGTKNLPDKKLLNYMEKNGVSFGKGLNAFTNTNITCFNLNDVPTTRESLIDSSLMILHEWAANVTFSTDEINKERGVIHEEWRTRGGAGRRMSDITNKVLYNNSKYSYRNVIGTLDVIDNFDPELVRKFYKDFYRPDLQAVIVVGDIDEAAIKSKIEQLFGNDPKRENPIVTPRIIVPDNKELMIGSATDKEAQNIEITLFTKFPDAPKKDVDFLKSNMLNSLYNSMFSERYSEILQKENPPFRGAYSGFSGFTEFQSSYTISIGALNNDPLRSVKAVMIENERVKRYGFTASELERAKKQMLAWYEKSFTERDKTFSSNYVGGYMNHFSSESPSPGIAYMNDLAKSYFPTVTIDQINALPKKWMIDENRVMIMQGPEKEGILLPTEQEIKNTLVEVQKMDIAPYQDKVIASSLLSKELKGSPVVKQKKIKDFEGTKLTLKNGATVYFKTTDNKADEVMLQAFSNGGTSLLSNEDLPSGDIASAVNSLCGVGEFSSQDLKKYLAGKVVSVNTGLSDLEEMIFGNSNVADMETMLQLVYLNFTAPRKDDAAMKSIIDRSKMSSQNRKSDPNSAFSDTLIRIMSNYNPRIRLNTPEYFDNIDIQKAYAISANRFQDASDFTFIFIGNVDVEKMKPLVEKYIGSIPDMDRKEHWKDLKIKPKKGKTAREINVEMKEPKAIVFVYYFGEYPCTPENVEYLNAIQYILRMRFTETLREKEGGTYGVNVNGSITSRPTNNYRLSMNFTCSPDKADLLKGMLYDEIKNLKENGVTETELSKTKENFLKEASEKLKSNGYIMDRVKNYINNGVYTPLPEYSVDIFNHLDGKKIQKLANEVFKDDIVELVMKPALPKVSEVNK